MTEEKSVTEFLAKWREELAADPYLARVPEFPAIGSYFLVDGTAYEVVSLNVDGNSFIVDLFVRPKPALEYITVDVGFHGGEIYVEPK